MSEINDNSEFNDDICGFPYISGIPEYIYESLDLPKTTKEAKEQLNEIFKVLEDFKLQLLQINTSIELEKIAATDNPMISLLMEKKSRIIKRNRFVFSQKRILEAWINREKTKGVIDNNLNQYELLNKRINDLSKKIEVLVKNSNEDAKIQSRLNKKIADLEAQMSSMKNLLKKEKQHRHKEGQEHQQQLKFFLRVIWDMVNHKDVSYVLESADFMSSLLEQIPDYGKVFRYPRENNVTHNNEE